MKVARLGQSRRAALVVASITFLATFGMRIANYRSAFVGGIPQISPFDELYHAKRIVYSNAHPFRVLDFDPSRGPRGSFCPWPPLYDMGAGALTRLIGASDPVRVVALASWFPPLVSAFVAALVAAWLSRRLGAAAGLLAGLGLALATYYLDWSRLGAIDHHFLEFPLTLGLIAATMLAAESKSSREALRAGGMLALAVVVALLVQTALLLAAGVAFLTILLLERKRVFTRLAAAGGFLLAAAMIVLYRWLQPAGYPDNEWFLGIPHVAALGAAASGCAVQYWLLRRGVSVPRSGLASILFALAVVVAIPNALEMILAGSRFLGGEAWLQSISQFRPLLVGSGSGWWAHLCLVGGGFFLTAAMVATPRWRQGRRGVFLPFALGYSLAAFTSLRFLAIAPPLCAISGAVAVTDMWREKRRWLSLAGAVLLLLPSVVLSTGRVLHPPPAVRSDMVPFLRAAEFVRNQSSARGRVLPPWTWGHLFDVVGGRSVLLDNFGPMAGRTDFENATAITLATRERAVADYCVAHGVRYVILQDPLPHFAAHAEMSGFPRSAFARVVDSSPTRLMRATFWWRAYFEGGRERPDLGPAGAPFGRFRMVRTEISPERSDIRSAVQVWELDPATGSPRK